MKLWAKQTGFTIVELLIVIVVIAILAAITIVAYNGIQQRARNSSKIQAASADLRAIDGYVTATGQDLPGISGGVCLPIGTADFDGDGSPDCGIVSSTSHQATEKAVTNTALSNEKISVAFPVDVVTNSSGVEYTGIIATYSSSSYGMNGKLQPYFLYFQLEGTDQDCGNGASIKIDSTQTDPLHKIIPAKNYGGGGGVTQCAYTIIGSGSL